MTTLRSPAPAGRRAPPPRANLKGVRAAGARGGGGGGASSAGPTCHLGAPEDPEPAAGLSCRGAPLPQPIRRRPWRRWGRRRPIGIREGGGTSLSNLITPFLFPARGKTGASAGAAATRSAARAWLPARAPACLSGGASGLERVWEQHMPALVFPDSSPLPTHVLFRLLPERTPGYLHGRWLFRATSFHLSMFSYTNPSTGKPLHASKPAETNNSL